MAGPPRTFKFLHAADLHIDSPLRGLSRHDGAPLERLRGATRLALQRLVVLAAAEQVALVVLAWGIYDRDWPDFHTGLFFREQMVALQRLGWTWRCMGAVFRPARCRKTWRPIIRRRCRVVSTSACCIPA